MHSYAADAKDDRRALSVPVALFLGAGVIYSVLSHGLNAFHGQATIFGYTIQRGPIRAPSALAIYFLLYGVFDRWAWHWPLVGRFLGLPDVRGEWKGRFISNSPTVGQGMVTLSIMQRWRRMSVDFAAQLDSPNAAGAPQLAFSTSTMASITGRTERTLRYEYRVTATSDVPAHEGVAHFELHLGASPARLEGRYYTNRDEHDGDAHQGQLTNFKRTRRTARKPDKVFEALKSQPNLRLREI